MTPDLRADEKLCPFCAEVIKAAAVKCRYCGSELPDPTTGRAPEPATVRSSSETHNDSDPERATKSATDQAASTTPSPAETVDGLVGTRRSFAAPLLAVGLAMLVIVLAAGLSLTVFVFSDSFKDARDGRVTPDGEVTSAAARAVLMDQAGKMTAAALSYDAKTFDKDTAAAGRLMTPSMRKQYLATLAEVRDDVAKQGLVLKAEVRASALVSATEDEARVLEFVNQSTTAKGVSRSQLNQNRVVVTLSRVDGRWLISKMDAF